MGADDPQLEVLLACFDGHKRAGKSRRQLDRRIKERGGTILDEVVVRVDHKGTVQVRDPRRVVAGTLTPALTWGVFGLLASGGWSGLLIWAVLGALCGGLYAFYTEHLLTKNELKRVGTRLSPDASALLLYVHGTDAKELLDDVAQEDPRLASAATIGTDLSATITSGAQNLIDVPSAAPGSAPPKSDSWLSMLMFRYEEQIRPRSVNAACGRPGEDEAASRSDRATRAGGQDGQVPRVSPGKGVRAFMPSDAIAWGLFGVVFGGIVGLAGNGGVLGFTEGAVVTGILWAIFGLVAGTLYGLWAGRAISARRFKPLRRLLPPDTSIALCWAEGPLSDDSIAEWSAPASDQLILRFNPITGGAVLEV